MANFIVPNTPPVIDITHSDPLKNEGVRAAHPVRSSGQWSDWMTAAGWAIAQGGTLVMLGPSSGAAPGAVQTWRFWIHPRYQIVARLWCLSLGMRGANLADWHATGTLEVPTGSPVGSWAIAPASAPNVSVFRFIEPVASPSADPQEMIVKLTVAATSGGPVYLEGLCCYEIHRVELDTFGPTPNTLGAFHAFATHPSTIQTGAVIRASNDQGRSVGGLMQNGIDPTMLETETRRSCLFTSYRPAGLTVGTAYTPVFLGYPPVLARTSFDNPSTSIAISARGVGPAGSNVRFTAGSGDVTTLVLPTSVGWVHGVLDVNGEDVTEWGTDGGLRGGLRDEITIEAQRVGAGTCIVYGIGMAESVATAAGA